MEVVTLLLANISSFRLRHAEALEMAKKCGAAAVLLTETRIRNEAKMAKFEASKAGYGALLSDPGPLKRGGLVGQGPREGGTAILAKEGWTTPDLGRQAKEHKLDPSYACRAAIPLRGKKRKAHLHIIVAYCNKDDEQQRKAVIEYAEAFGDVPVVVAADWNQPAEESQAVVNATCTGRRVGGGREPHGARRRGGNGDAAGTDHA